ncbi:hypothetical protein HK104_006871 [Borealophlyctis nickersoniae]|nr:hypothetical protein HK104_006871 [Borealophlyctis nickersoniae]
MSKSSLQSIHKKNIFVLGGSRESAMKKLKEIGLTTAEMLDELVYLYQIELKAKGEIDELQNILAERLKTDEFGLRNVTLDSNKLMLFVSNTQVFEWFAKAYSDIASRIQAGFRERLAPPMSDAERVRELEEQNQEASDGRDDSGVDSSGGEESDGRDDRRAEDALDDEINRSFSEMVEKEGRDDKGGEASAATNNVEVVLEYSDA